MKTMVLHVKASMRSLPWFAALPTFSEYAVENGWTMCFSRISEVGWFAYLVYIMAYIVFVEFVTYWIHRKLHDIKPLYKYLHVQHHSYNKQHKLSPLAGKFFLLLLIGGLPSYIPFSAFQRSFETRISSIFLSTRHGLKKNTCHLLP